MKKLLSFILALSLAFSLLPTFAFAVDMEKAELTPESKFTLNFKAANVFCNGSEIADKTLIGSDNYTLVGPKSGERWSLASKEDGSTILSYTAAKGKVMFRTGYLRLSATSTMIGARATLVIKFNVENAGYYDVSFVPYGLTDGGTGKVSIDSETACSKNFYGSTNAALPSESLYDKIYLSAGEHKITLESVSAGTEDGYYVAVQSFTFAPSEPTANQGNPKVSFVQTTNVAGYPESITVKSVTRGNSVDLTAHKEEISGYEFVGWKRGSNDADSAWIDISGDEYEVWTNTFLTAIYKPVRETAAKTVDFWNQNGAYMGTADDEDTFKEMVVIEPKLTGFGTFKGWFTDDKVQLDENSVLSAGTTNAVAQYEDGVVSGVKRDGVEVDGANVYNKAITFEKKDTSSTCWMRDGKTISYDDSYTYNVWGATNIMEGTHTGDKNPVAILEYNADYDAYMLEYDAGAYTIAEAGIIFGGADATVDSCIKKYTSQRKVSHNQFTVPAESGTAKGYIIWKNASGAYNIEYFSVAE